MPNPKRIEPLTDDEFDFIEKRYITAAKQFYFGMKILLVFILVLPLGLVLVYHYFETNDDLTRREIWLYAQVITLIIFALTYIAGYFQLVYAYTRDIKCKQKIIETVIIEEKKYIPLNNSYHFYINSEPTYTIEVEHDIYNSFNINDEINIEYARYTEIYLGYF